MLYSQGALGCLLNLKREVIRRDSLFVASQDGDGAGHIEALFTGVAGIEVESLADLLAEFLVGMAEDDDIGILADDAAFDFIVVGGVDIEDVMEEELAAVELEEFGFFKLEAGVVIAEDGGDGGDILELEDEPGQADIAGVEDMVDAFE